MLIVPFVSSLLILTLVLYEVQNAMKAVVYAADWPANARLEFTSEGMRAFHGAPLSPRSRVLMAIGRMAYCSLLMHEVHCWSHSQSPVFRAYPSFLFGAVVGAGALFTGLPDESALALAVCSAGILFGSSQVRAVARFYALRVESDKQISALLASI